MATCRCSVSQFRNRIFSSTAVNPKLLVTPVASAIDISNAGFWTWDAVNDVANLPAAGSVYIASDGSILMRAGGRLAEADFGMSALSVATEARSIKSCSVIDFRMVGAPDTVAAAMVFQTMFTLYAVAPKPWGPAVYCSIHVEVNYVAGVPTPRLRVEEGGGLFPVILTNPVDAVFNRLKVSADRIASDHKRYTFTIFDTNLGVTVSGVFNHGPGAVGVGDIPILWHYDQEGGGLGLAPNAWTMAIDRWQTSHLDIPYRTPRLVI